MIGPSALSSKIEVGMTPKKLWEAWTIAAAMYRLKGFAFLKSKKNIKNRREVLTLLNIGVVLYSQGGVLQENFFIKTLGNLFVDYLKKIWKNFMHLKAQ